MVRITLALIGLTLTPAFAADQALIDAAKREGTVTWYTTSIIDQFVRPASDAFYKKHGIRVEFSRGSNAQIELRVINEARAGRMLADLVDGTQTSLVLRREGYIEKWLPPNALAPRYVDPEGHWIATNEYALTPGFNTDLVPRGSEPRTFGDLLSPRWKGKMAWNVSPAASAGQGLVGAVLAEMGEVKAHLYFAELAKQNIAGLKTSARQVLDQAIAGEFPIVLQIFNNHTAISRARGAPIDWIAMEPAIAVMHVMSLTKGGPHPNAARLFFEFVISDEGQQIMAQAGEIPVSSNVPPGDPGLRPGPGTFRSIYFTPEQLAASTPVWSRIFDEYFR